MFEFFKKKDEKAPEQQHEKHVIEENSGFSFSFEKLKSTVANTAKSLVQSVTGNLEDKEEFDEFALDDTEELLIKADIGVNTAAEITDKLREKNSKIKPSEIRAFLKNEFDNILESAGSEKLNVKEGLNIYLITGVNGAGKTTLIAKLAYQFKNQGKKVLVAAGDTFRAAAEEQLNIWSERAGADIVRKDGIDAAAVAFDAIKKAQSENYDILLIDTAGRLQNKHNLMEELGKMTAVINKLAPDCFTVFWLLMQTQVKMVCNRRKFSKKPQILRALPLRNLMAVQKAVLSLRLQKNFLFP